MVDFALQGNTLSVVQQQMAETSTLNDNDPTGLPWTFTGRDGTVLDQGEVPEERVLTSEFDESGMPSPEQHVEPTMVFSLRLPNTEGTLRIQTALGSAAVAPQTAGVRLQSSPGASGSSSSSLDVPPFSPSSGGGGCGNAASISSGPPQDVTLLRKADAVNAPCGFNVLIVPEAFQDMGAFHAAAQSLVGSVLQDSTWGAYAHAANFWVEDIVSQDDTYFDPANGIPRNTAFMGELQGRAIIPRQVPNATWARVAGAIRATDAKLLGVIVNTDIYAGSAAPFMSGQVRYVQLTRNPETDDIVLHELGHSLLALGDEYNDNPPPCDPAQNEKSPKPDDEPECAPRSMAKAWSRGRRGVGTPLPWSAAYCTSGVWHPTESCLMHTLRTPMCPVCAAQMLAVLGPPPSLTPTPTPAPGGGGSLTVPGTPLICSMGIHLR